MNFASSVEVNGILNSGIQFWQLIILLIITIIGIVTIRFTFSFDINKHREAKQASYGQRLMNACPHVKAITNENGEQGLQSTYISPPGTLQWQCQRCGRTTYQQGNESEVRVRHYIDHIDEFTKQNRKFQKLLKKAGMI